MRTTIVIGFILLGSLQVWAADSDLFPLQQLELGMTATDMLKAYPNVKTGFVKNNAQGNGLMDWLFVKSPMVSFGTRL